MRLAMTPTARYAVRRCADALSDLQLRLLNLADGSRDVETLVHDCAIGHPDDVQRALGGLLKLELLAPLARMQDPRPVRKRSAAAAKMYLVAVFDRLRRARAAQMRESLLATRDECGLVDAIHQAIPLLEAHTSPGFATRVMAELQQLLPEHLTDSMDLLMARTLRKAAAQ